MSTLAVRDLALDLDAFEGPFDLLLTLILREELPLSDVAIAEIVLAFGEQITTTPTAGERPAPASSVERPLSSSLGEAALPLDVEACGEFLVLAAALLELKGRALVADDGEADVDELDPEEAATELAERLAEYGRIKAGAEWLADRLEREGDRFFRLGPAPIAFQGPRPLPPQDPQALAEAIKTLAAEPPSPSLAHLALRLPSLEAFVERFRAVLRRQRRFTFDDEVEGLSRIEQAVAFVALLELRKAGDVELEQPAPLEPIDVVAAGSRRHRL